MGVIFSVSYFYINQQTIVLEQCIQRDRIENTCQGNCYLAEKINQSKKTPIESNTEEIEVKIPQFIGDISIDKTILTLTILKIFHTRNISFLNQLQTSDLFRPPILV